MTILTTPSWSLSAQTWTYNNCEETHLGGWVLSPCWSPLLADSFIACCFFFIARWFFPLLGDACTWPKHCTGRLWTRLEYKLVICPGIHKVREEPATRSAVATWTLYQLSLKHTIFPIPLDLDTKNFTQLPLQPFSADFNTNYTHSLTSSQ